MIQHRKKRDLDGQDIGWLRTFHHFVVRPEGNMDHRPLGPLIVWNDDEIAPGTGFPMHGHRDIEIISYVRQGAVTHGDNAGGAGRTVAGDVQVISAGHGIRHEEFNRESEPLRLFQIWIASNQKGAAPRWNSRRFPRSDRNGRLVTLASGLPGDEDALPIRASARVMGAIVQPDEVVAHDLAPLSSAYLVSARGALEVNGEAVEEGDGVALSKLDRITIRADRHSAEVILVEVL
jgi:redox-sensitive bicupin YhaK (pirin superfamily)